MYIIHHVKVLGTTNSLALLLAFNTVDSVSPLCLDCTNRTKVTTVRIVEYVANYTKVDMFMNISALVQLATYSTKLNNEPMFIVLWVC